MCELKILFLLYSKIMTLDEVVFFNSTPLVVTDENECM